MRFHFYVTLLMVFVLSACGATAAPEPTSTQEPTATIEPTRTSTPRPTLTSTPTEVPSSLFEPNGIESLVAANGFVVSVPFPLSYQASENAVLIGNEDSSFTASFGSDTYDGAQPLMDVIDSYLASLEDRGWQFVKGDVADIEVDGHAGIATNLAGTAGKIIFEGQAVAVSPGSGLVLFGLGISIINNDKNNWVNSGQPTFEGLIEKVKFTDSNDGACPVSSDQTYGYSQSNPILIGGDAFGGPSRERAYLEHLRGPNGESLTYEREGSTSTDTTILDAFKVTGTGINVTLYLDEYNYDPPQAPVGFTCNGAFPLSAP